MKKRKANFSGFTLTELLTIMGIIGILLVILLPAFSSVSESRRSSQCVHNLRQIGVGAQLWAAEHNNTVLPRAVIPNSGRNRDWWPQQVAPYLVAPNTTPSNRSIVELDCPTGDLHTVAPQWSTTYAMIRQREMMSASSVNRPSSKAYIVDSGWSGNRSGWGWDERSVSTDEKNYRAILIRHKGRANVLFHDGHVASYGESEFPVPPKHATDSPEFRSLFDPIY